MTDYIDRVDAHANDEWRDLADRAVRFIAQEMDEFTTDPVLDVMEAYPEITTHEPRALGPVMIRAVKNGICKIKTCDECGTRKVVVQSSRRGRHSTDQAVYVSLLRGAQNASSRP